MEVAPGIHRLTGGVPNFYLVDEGGKFLVVDAGTAGDWGLFARAVSSGGRTLSDVSAVLITHAHSDHTGFAERARADAKVAVWIHEADAEAARTGRPGRNEARLIRYLFRPEAWRTLVGLARRGGTKVVPIREVSTFADGQALDVPGRPRVVHVPGHTPGMAALFFERRRALMTGDSLVTRNPLTGRRGPQIMPSALNRSSGQALRSLDRLEGLGAELVLPGHGEPWTRGVGEAVRLARMAGRS